MRVSTKLRIIAEQTAKLENKMIGADTLAQLKRIENKRMSVADMAAANMFGIVTGHHKNGSEQVTELQYVLGYKKQPRKYKRKADSERVYKGNTINGLADTMKTPIGNPGSDERVAALAAYYADPRNDENSPFEVDLEDMITSILIPNEPKVYSATRGSGRKSLENVTYHGKGGE